MTDIVERLRNPPFGTETSERLLMATAADEIAALRRENEALRKERDEALEQSRLHAADAGIAWGQCEALRKELAEARDMALEEAARVAYRECAQTRHGRLGDTVVATIRSMKGDGK